MGHKELTQIAALHAWTCANKYSLEAYYYIVNNQSFEACAALCKGLSLRILYCSHHELWKTAVVREIVVMAYLALTIGHEELFFHSITCLERVFGCVRQYMDMKLVLIGISRMCRAKHYGKASHLTKLLFESKKYY